MDKTNPDKDVQKNDDEKIANISDDVVYSNLSDVQVTNLLNATYKDTQEFTITNLKGWSKIVNVYDGDTVHIAIYFKDEIYKITCRILGIDTAELKTKNIREKEHAVKTKNRVIELTNDKLVWVNIVNSNDKYGRYLTKIYLDDTETRSISDILISEGLAYKYDGKTKKRFDDWCPIE